MTGANVANLICAGALFVLAALIYRALPRPTRITAMPAELTEPDDRSRWGTDIALHEACARIWDLPEADPTAGFDRLQQAINDDTEGNP